MYRDGEIRLYLIQHQGFYPPRGLWYLSTLPCPTRVNLQCVKSYLLNLQLFPPEEKRALCTLTMNCYFQPT